MVYIKAKIKIAPILFQLDTLITNASHTALKKLVEMMVLDARIILEKSVAENNGVWSGNLASAITAKSGSAGIKTFVRWDIVVNTDKAPYAEWIEAGRFADAVPYSKSKNRDYKKSDFEGHRYLEQTLEKYADIAPRLLLTDMFINIKQNAGTIKA